MTQEYKYFKNEYVDSIQNNYFKPILNEIFDTHGNDIRLLADVGCGNGIFTAYLKEHHDLKIYGYDASEHALKCAHENGFDEVILNNDFSTNRLQVGDGYFDFVLNKDVLEHLIDPEFHIREISRVLKRDGFLLLHVPNDFNLWKRIGFVFSNDVDTYKYFPDSKEWNRPHVRFFSYNGILEMLEANGFSIIKNYSSYFTHRLRLFHRIPGFMAIGRWLADRYPSQFSQAFTILVKKSR